MPALNNYKEVKQKLDEVKDKFALFIFEGFRPV